MDIRVGGWRPEPPSSKDKTFDEIRGRLSIASNVDKIDLRYLCSPIENQSSSNSCTGNASVSALEMLEIRQGLQFVDLSRLFAYYNGRMGMNPTEGHLDNGTFIRLVMDGLHKFGVCSETEWSYDLDIVTMRPSWDSYRVAWKHRIDNFYKIDAVGEVLLGNIEEACLAKHGVVFGSEVYESYQSCSGQISIPKSGEKLLGGHAQLIVGFDRPSRMLIIKNSWGDGWGDQGYGYMPYDYLDAARANDFWVPTRFT